MWVHAHICFCVHAQLFSHIRFFAAPWTVACQTPLSMGLFRQEYWSGLPFPPPGNLPNWGIKPASSASPSLAGGFFTTEQHGKPTYLSLLPTYSRMFRELYQSEIYSAAGNRKPLREWLAQRKEVVAVWNKFRCRQSKSGERLNGLWTLLSSGCTTLTVGSHL